MSRVGAHAWLHMGWMWHKVKKCTSQKGSCVVFPVPVRTLLTIDFSHHTCVMWPETVPIMGIKAWVFFCQLWIRHHWSNCEHHHAKAIQNGQGKSHRSHWSRWKLQSCRMGNGCEPQIHQWVVEKIPKHKWCCRFTTPGKAKADHQATRPFHRQCSTEE